ncbi:hypothetical protein Tco_1208866, partial [Tanacetum coccineum]
AAVAGDAGRRVKAKAKLEANRERHLEVYKIIVAAGITKSSKVQEQYPELEVRPKLIPCGHICMMEARELWQWMKFNADLLKAQSWGQKVVSGIEAAWGAKKTENETEKGREQVLGIKR